MNIKTISYRFILTAVMMALAPPFTAEAQFLQKLSQGLEKVNKGLEKFEKALQPGNKKVENKPKQTAQDSQSTTSTSRSSADESAQKGAEPSYTTPYFTAQTKFMITNPSDYDISDVHDGVFAVKRGMGYEFWKVTGEKLFDADWKYAGGSLTGFPIFSDGVAAAKRAQPDANGKTPICLLYVDGRVKELDPSWETVSQFMDGAALVTARINYKEQAFYIDTNGNKLYPNLKVEADYGNPMRPLCDGLRAYYGKIEDPVGYGWGFIDAEGNVKIAPKYNKVSDFANGYAWVASINYSKGIDCKELIDVTGKVVFKTDGNDTHTSDVYDGVFCVERSSQTVYYDLSGEELAAYKSCSGFCDGYAFIAQGYQHAEVIDRNFNIVKRMPYDYCNADDVDYNKPDFKPFGLATIRWGTTVIDSKGNIVLTGYNNHRGTYIRGFKQFSESGYMKATEFNINGKQCMAFVKPSGEIAWLFSETKLFGSEEPPLPEPPLPGPITPRPPFPPIPVKPDQPPIGPIDVENVSFTVKVIAAPSEGGSASISPAGKFGYGEHATLTATPNKDWAVRSIETDAGGTAPQAGKPFAVTTDMTIIVNFIEKEEEEAPDNFGAYIGQVTLEEEWVIPVYAEINQKGVEENPYGANNYGFVSLMFDPDKRYSDKKGEFSVNMFAVPLKIVGIQKDDADTTKQWLVVEGGSVSIHNLEISTASDPLFGMALQGMMAFDGFTSINSLPRRYRIEMLDRNSETGEFRFGNMQTYSTEAGGWVYGDDPSLKKTTKGFFGSYNDRGYPSDTFAGARMTKTQKRNDILWYPPEKWSKDKSEYQQMVQSMGAAYRNSKSDYGQIFDE